MKLSIISLLFIIASSSPVPAQNSSKFQTEEFTVKGVCEMCQKRIEKAALISGVISTNWDKNTQLLKVIYKTKKTSLKEIKKAVAEAGHDTDEIKATDETYAKLPDCCAYRDGVKVH